MSGHDQNEEFRQGQLPTPGSGGSGQRQGDEPPHPRSQPQSQSKKSRLLAHAPYPQPPPPSLGSITGPRLSYADLGYEADVPPRVSLPAGTTDSLSSMHRGAPVSSQGMIPPTATDFNPQSRDDSAVRTGLNMPPARLPKVRFICREVSCDTRSDSSLSQIKHERTHKKPNFLCEVEPCYKAFSHVHPLEHHVKCDHAALYPDRFYCRFTGCAVSGPDERTRKAHEVSHTQGKVPDEQVPPATIYPEIPSLSVAQLIQPDTATNAISWICKLDGCMHMPFQHRSRVQTHYTMDHSGSQDPNLFSCRASGCTEPSFEDEVAQIRHEDEVHIWGGPITCRIYGCQDKKPFSSLNNRRKHEAQHKIGRHYQKLEKRMFCPVEGERCCIFLQESDILLHLKQKHPEYLEAQQASEPRPQTTTRSSNQQTGQQHDTSQLSSANAGQAREVRKKMAIGNFVNPPTAITSHEADSSQGQQSHRGSQPLEGQRGTTQSSARPVSQPADRSYSMRIGSATNPDFSVGGITRATESLSMQSTTVTAPAQTSREKRPSKTPGPSTANYSWLPSAGEKEEASPSRGMQHRKSDSPDTSNPPAPKKQKK